MFGFQKLARRAGRSFLGASVLALGVALGGGAHAADGTFLVQLKDYDGDEAYFAMYLVDPEGRYVRTLWVSGDEERWYADMPRWWKYVGRAPQDLDAVTGASTAPADRSLVRIQLGDDEIDAGYSVRVETAVEDQENHPVDVEAKLDSALMRDKIPGTGYVRYLRFKW
ncbi:MAG: flagellin biosynthesis protein FlgD [Rhodobacterales bacterium]|nr:MAG: flagellin biosynthesis protein FlgD [Rhodobacterales bacterium]